MEMALDFLSVPVMFFTAAYCALGPATLNMDVSSRLFWCCLAMIPLFSASSAFGIASAAGPMYGIATCCAFVVGTYTYMFYTRYNGGLDLTEEQIT